MNRNNVLQAYKNMKKGKEKKKEHKCSNFVGGLRGGFWEVGSLVFRAPFVPQRAPSREKPRRAERKAQKTMRCALDGVLEASFSLAPLLFGSS